MALKNTENTKVNTYVMEVSVDSDTFAEACRKVYKKQVKNIFIPGFRKGKAPKAIIERMYGPEVFYDDAIKECYPKALGEAVEESGLNVIAVDEVEVVDASKDGCTFKATVITYPEVDIDGYKGIEATVTPIVVTEEMIDKDIEAVRDRNSRIVTVEDGVVEEGDTAVIDYTGTKDGVEFDGGKAENHELVIGSNTFIPGFEEQIIGHKSEDEFTINVTFPEEYHAEELSGQEVQFAIKLHEIKRKELPELDDEFVKDVSECETLDEYREETKNNITKRLESERDRDIENQVFEALVEKVEGDIPEAMFENSINEMLKEFDLRLKNSNLSLEGYKKYMNIGDDELREMYRPEAEKRVKLRLALEKIAEKEGFEVSEQELEDEFNRLAESYNMKVDEVKKFIDADDLASDLKSQKSVDLVKAEAVVEEKEETAETEETTEE